MAFALHWILRRRRRSSRLLLSAQPSLPTKRSDARTDARSTVVSVNINNSTGEEEWSSKLSRWSMQAVRHIRSRVRWLELLVADHTRKPVVRLQRFIEKGNSDHVVGP